MKRVFAAAVFGGLLTFLIPQASFADHSADHKGDCAGKTEAAPEPEQSAPGARSQYDHEQKQSDGGEILF